MKVEQEKAHYSYEEVFTASLEYFHWDELAAKVFVDKYALRDNKGNILELTPDDMHKRMAIALTNIEASKFKQPLTFDEIYLAFKGFTRIIPQGSILYGLGNYYQKVSLSNCFVVESPGDSFGFIHRSDEQLSQLSKRRCGVGICLDELRPNGTPTNNSSRTSTGIVPFCERFSNTIRGVGQNNRRGALLECVSVHHPDILDFIRMKLDETKVTGANVSVKLTDEFLLAVENDEEYEQRFPVDSKTPLISKMVKAKDIWSEIIRCAWLRAEPGLLFWDNIIKESPSDCYADKGFKTIATNPSLRWNTKVLTDQGYFNIIDLVGRDDLKVFTINNEWHSFKCFLSGQNKQLWKITLENGKVLYSTGEHKWPIIDSLASRPLLKFKTCELLPAEHKFWPITWNELPVEIISVEPTEIYEDVYDLTVFDVTHTFFIEETCFTGNCSELPLSALDSCRLLLLNLYSYVSFPFNKRASFEFSRFYADVKLAQRLMDDLIDAELLCIEKIIEKIENDPEPGYIKTVELEMWEKAYWSCKHGRRTGTGITALGDTIAALGLKYGSKESIDFTDKVYKVLKLGAYASSVEMAKELGAFTVWDHEKEKDNLFLNRIKEDKLEGIVDGKDIYALMKKYGRRNIALLTTAPAGTVSLLAAIGKRFGTTSGIEPTFKTHYMRRRKITHDVVTKADFVDKTGDKWQEFIICAAGPQEWMDLTGKNDLQQSPYNGACAEEINWVNRVKLQAAAGKHVDHSISSTINLPEDVKEDEVAKIYQSAWKMKLKGITVYRKNCRSGVLIDIKDNPTVERPKEVNCDVYHITVKGKSYFVLVGLINNKPYEVFAGRNGFLKKSVKHGKVIRIKKGYYKAILDDDTEIVPLSSAAEEHEETITRLTSACLQASNGDITKVVDQLEKINGSYQNFATSIVKALKKYIPDGTKVNDECPECHQLSLIRSGGCKSCQNCGWTAC